MATKKTLAASSVGGTSMTPNKSTNKSDKESDNVYFSLAVVVIVILVVIGIIFGYTKDKINKLNEAQEQSEALATQLQDVTKKIASLQDKTNTLEIINKENQALVVDMLEKERKIPDNVDTTNWTVYKDEDSAFQIKLPTTWEKAKPLIVNDQKSATTQPTDKTTIEKETANPVTKAVVYFQPKAMPDFSQAVSIEEDYLDFAALTMKEKYDIFKDLKLIDEFNFVNGTGLYFLNLNDAGEQIPTVLLLTKKHIFRMSFNAIDKQAPGYLTYRSYFEKIASTFTTVVEAAKK
ncbi:hypothetical protein HY932_02425 [Candidatus Falkowbacteria bacterium]|nr:hypothetical protein [Candidatus Falkowbacteria bacterium]